MFAAWSTVYHSCGYLACSVRRQKTGWISDLVYESDCIHSRPSTLHLSTVCPCTSMACVMASTCSICQLLDRLFQSVSQVGNGAYCDLLFFFSFLDSPSSVRGGPVHRLHLAGLPHLHYISRRTQELLALIKDLLVKQQSYSSTNGPTVQ